MIRQQLFDGKYKIITTLGSGGSSTVYLAQHVKLGTLWAIKQVRKLTDSRIDLLAEPNILKLLNHPSLPRIFDIVEEDQHLYIIEDFVEGISLQKEIESQGKIEESKVINWAKQLCDVLHYLHTFKPDPIIFRDLKPANIMLTYDGKIKLIDFGIARQYKDESVYDTTNIGTKGYAAPEQYGIGQTDARTDIYSLGVTLYHLLTGKSPCEPPYEFRPIREYNPGLSQEIEWIIAKCIEQNPDKRFQTVMELKQRLTEAAERSKEVLVDNKSLQKESGNEGYKTIDDTEVLQTELLQTHLRRNNSEQTTLKRSNPVIFKKLVLSVWGDTEFAAEIAYIADKLTNFDILLVDLDYESSKLGYYLNLQTMSSKGLDYILNALQNNMLTYEMLKNACSLPNTTNRLHVLLNSGIKYYGKYNEICIHRFIEYAYQMFDVTVIALNPSVFDPHTVAALSKSDYSIIPFKATIDIIHECRNHISYLNKKHSIPIHKVRYLAYEYKKGIHPSEKDIKNEIGKELYIGSISYQSQREICRNYATIFAQHMQQRCIDEYRDILAYFNIIPAKVVGSSIINWWKNL